MSESVSIQANRSDGDGLCLLSLDGGGIRSIASLMLLQQLMEQVNPDNPPRPCDYFDMIGGTSTGGLIAVMLGRLRMTVQQALDQYMKLSPLIFNKLHHCLNFKGETQARYDSDAIKNSVIGILSNMGLAGDELLKDTTPANCKTFVCATNKHNSQIVVFSSYYSSRRGGTMRNKVKMWEAVRATSAASSFFDPITIDGKEFVDSATSANNPLAELWTEAGDVFKKDPSWRLEDNIKCLVSIGTGRPKFKKFDVDPVRPIVATPTAIATDTEKVWEDFHKHRSYMVKQGRLCRFNVDRGLEDIELDETKSIPEISSATEHYIQREDIKDGMESCARILAQRESMSQFA